MIKKIMYLFLGVWSGLMLDGSLYAQQANVSAGGDISTSAGSFSISVGLTGFRYHKSPSAGSVQFGMQFGHPVFFTGKIPETLDLTNELISGGASPCFAALATLTTAGDGTTFVVENDGYVRLEAAGSIRMLPGTTVESGGGLLARIVTDNVFCQEETLKSQKVPRVPLADEEPTGEEQSMAVAVEAGMPATPGFNVYPNPSSGAFTVDLGAFADVHTMVMVEVYGMRGERVLQQQVAGGQPHLFYLDGQQPGIYIIRVAGGNQSGTKRIILR